MSSYTNRYKELLKDTFLIALGNIGSKMIVFFLVPLYTYCLTPDEYGISDLVFTISQLAIPFFSLVIFDAVIRFAILYKDQPENVLRAGIRVWVIGTVFTIIATPLFGLYKPVNEWRWYITGYISFSILLSIELNYLKATNRNLAFSIICIFQTFILACSNIILLVYHNMGIRGYLISYVTSSGIAAAVAFFVGKIYVDLKKSQYDKVLCRQMIAYSTPLILNNLSWWAIHSSDKLMLESMIGEYALGLYSVAARIPSLVSVFVTIFQQAWGISSSKEMDSENDSGFYSNVFTIYSTVAFLGGIVLCIIIKPFMDIYIRSEAYGDVWRYVPLLIASAVFSALAAYCGSMYGALKRSINNMNSTFAAAVINVVVNYVAILRYGIWGAMIGTIVAYTVLAFIRIIDIKRYVNIEIEWRKLIINSVLMICQAVAVSLCSVIIGFSVSICCLIVFVVTNRGELYRIIAKLKTRRTH